MTKMLPTLSRSVARPTATKRSRSRNNNLVGYLFIAPWLIGFFVFTLAPLVASFLLAFTDYDILTAPNWIGFANFRRMFFEDRRYWNAVVATLYYVVASVPLRLVVALLVALMLNTAYRMVGVYRALLYVPSIIGGSVAVALMWRKIFGADGLVNVGLDAVGIQGLNWLGNPRTAIWTLILLAAWQFGSPMLIFLAGLKQIPVSFYEAAAIDGAGALTKFWRITLPMLTPIILFNLIMQIISGFMVFAQGLIITGGGPLDTTLFYAVYLYNKAFRDFEMGYSAAMAWVLLVIIACFTAFVFRSSSAWVFYASKEE